MGRGSARFSELQDKALGLTGWFFVGNEGMRALYMPFKGLYRGPIYTLWALIPSIPTKNQGVKAGDG